MQRQSLVNPSGHMAQNDAALRWSARQNMMDWALRKSGGALVPVEYQQAKWWNHFLTGGASRLSNNR